MPPDGFIPHPDGSLLCITADFAVHSVQPKQYRYLSDQVKFTGDVAGAPIPQLAKIKASLVDPPHHPQHLSFESWRKVYR